MTQQVIQVWDRLIHYAECDGQELQDVVSILLELADGTSDVMLIEPLTKRASVAALGLRSASPRSLGPSIIRYESTENNRHIMDCKLAVCHLVSGTLDLLAEEKVNQIVDHVFTQQLADVKALTGKMMYSLRESVTNPVFIALKERLLPILRDLLMYQHDELV